MQPTEAGGEPGLAAEQVARDLANELMSPYCPGRTISSCPSKNARQLEDFMLEQAAAGKSRDEIEQLLVEEFGRETLGSVTSPPFMFAAGLVALLAAVAVGVLGRRWLRRGRLAGAGGSQPAAGGALGAPGQAAGPSPGEGSPSADPTATPMPTEDELEQLEDALAELREF